jgi:hypothetical protein
MSDYQKMKKVVLEINSILEREDLMGFIFLADGKGGGEVAYNLENTSWSQLKIYQDKNRIHFKGHMKSSPRETSMTINAIFLLQEILGRSFMMLDEIKKVMNQNIDIEAEELRHLD